MKNWVNSLLVTQLFVLIIFAGNVLAKEPKFLFSEDQSIVNEDMDSIVKYNGNIRTDNWFNSPPTRTEMIAFTLNQYIKKEFETFWEYYSSEEINDYFYIDDILPLTAGAKSSYYRKKDKFVVSVNVRNYGKPKKPMKEFCDSILRFLSINLDGRYYLYHNTFLHPFITGEYDDPEVSKIIEILRNNLLVIVSVETSYPDDNNSGMMQYFQLRGYRNFPEETIHYIKQSSKFSKK